MLRRFFGGVFGAVQQPQELTVHQSAFTRPETAPFTWLTELLPCFPINSSNLKILTEPQQFYKQIRDGCATAENRIVLVSLYLGNGNLERKLVDTLLNNRNFRTGDLKVRVLLDYTRGSRGVAENSRTVLQPLLVVNEKNCQVSLYHTPKLRGIIKKLTPNRWNELLGLQHMKLYIFDDTLVISGANLSNDYFTNRQDRYFVINDRRLCDFYCGLVRNVQKFSLKMTANNQIVVSEDSQQLPYEGDKNKFIAKAKRIIDDYLTETKNQPIDDDNYDTWIFPMVQMGQFGIYQDSQITDRLLRDAPIGSRLKIATGYFNLTQQYMETLLKYCRGDCEILMAHPRCNGFYGAKGPAGAIPAAYSLIARKFQQQFDKHGADQRIKLFEYLRDNWTYHSKGLWYYPPNCRYPCLTLIGSPNFGERSVYRDLETQVAVITENPELRRRFDEEYRRLARFALPADTRKNVPKWVRVFVAFFRNYF